MNHLDYNKNLDYPTTLTKAEIMDPFGTLDKLIDGQTAGLLQDEFWELITCAFRPFYWTRYNAPLDLYLKYRKLVKLIELLSLMKEIRPSDEEKGRRGQRSFDGLFAKCKEDPTDNGMSHDPLSNAYDRLLEVQDGDDFYHLKYRMKEYTVHGLNHSFHSYSLDFNDDIFNCCDNFFLMTEAMFVIIHLELFKDYSEKDRLRLEEIAVQHGTDSERPTYMYDEDITEVFFFIEYDKVRDELTSFLLHDERNNYWKTHNDPGNVILLFDELLFLIESSWLYWQHADDDLKKVDWNIPEDALKKMTKLKADECKRPLAVVETFFGKRSLADWRKELENWKQALLGNKKIHEFKQSTYYHHTQDLLSLFDVAYLMKYEPDLEKEEE